MIGQAAAVFTSCLLQLVFQGSLIHTDTHAGDFQGALQMLMQSCDITDNRRDLLCGNWESVEGKPDVLIYKEGEAYKVTVFKRSGIRRKLKPETYLLQEENGNLFMNTGFRIDVSYNEATDILTFSPNGDYVRVNPKPDHPIGEQ